MSDMGSRDGKGCLGEGSGSSRGAWQRCWWCGQLRAQGGCVCHVVRQGGRQAAGVGVQGDGASAVQLAGGDVKRWGRRRRRDRRWAWDGHGGGRGLELRVLWGAPRESVRQEEAGEDEYVGDGLRGKGKQVAKTGRFGDDRFFAWVTPCMSCQHYRALPPRHNSRELYACKTY